MNFELSDQQRDLGDSLKKLLAKACDFRSRAAILSQEPGYSRELWQQFIYLGLTALPIPQAYGGFDGTAIDLMPVMEELGRALVVEPYLSSVVMGATALRLTGDARQCGRILPSVALGETLLAFAHDEPEIRHPMWVATTARQADGHWLLIGAKSNVLHGQTADHIVVSARVSGQPGTKEGVALFLLDGTAPGLTRRDGRLLDDTPASALTLESAVAIRLTDVQPGTGAVIVRQVLELATAAACAQAVGCMQAAYDMTREYLRMRQQFGKPIGQNQALRHRAADMLVQLETCRSMAMLAAMAASAPPSTQTALDIMRAKALIAKYSRLLCLEAVQMHGGIGMTEEYMVGHFLRRVTVLDYLFGDEHQQLANLAAQLREADPLTANSPNTTKGMHNGLHTE